MGREITEQQRSWLVSQLENWRGEGIVSGEQAGAILSLYGTQEEIRQRRQSQAILTLVSLAALLVGMGVLLLIGYNWESMPIAAKVIAILGAVTATHATGFLLRFKYGYRTLSEAAFFLGCLLYGGGIWLIAQVFQVSGHDPDLFWWWAVGVLPFALALDTLVMHFLLVTLLAIWAGYEVLGFGDMGQWLFWGRARSIPDGAYGLLALATPGFWWAYRKKSAQAISLYVPLIAWWVVLQPFAWKLQSNPTYYIGAVGALLLLLAEAHKPGSPMAIPYRFFGAALIAGVLIPLSYHGVNRSMGQSLSQSWSILQPMAIAVLSVGVLAAIILARRGSAKGPADLPSQLLELARCQWLPCSLVVLMTVLGLWSGTQGDPLLPTIAANVAMVVLAFWLMQVGLREDRGTPFGAGVIYFLLWAVLRYIDLFGEFGGMLGAALVFFACGATLFGVAYFWNHRKAVSHA